MYYYYHRHCQHYHSNAILPGLGIHNHLSIFPHTEKTYMTKTEVSA